MSLRWSNIIAKFAAVEHKFAAKPAAAAKPADSDTGYDPPPPPPLLRRRHLARRLNMCQAFSNSVCASPQPLKIADPGDPSLNVSDSTAPTQTPTQVLSNSAKLKIH